MACGDFPYDCIADYAIDLALIFLVVALGAWLLAALGDTITSGLLGGAVRTTMSIAGASLIGGAATALMMCASREMADFLKEVIDEQLLLAEEYNAVFMQMFAKNPDFYAWGRHGEVYEEACEQGSVARARTPALIKTSTEAYRANKSRGRFQVGLGRRLFRDSAKAAGMMPAAMMATMANIEERMKLTAELGNWARRTSVLRTLGHLPHLSTGYRTAMKSYASILDTTTGLTGYLAKQTGAALRLAIEPALVGSGAQKSGEGAGPELFRLPQETTDESNIPRLLRQSSGDDFYSGILSRDLRSAITPDYTQLPAPPIDPPLLGPDI